jgi:hypothetical protein
MLILWAFPALFLLFRPPSYAMKLRDHRIAL